MLKGKYNTGDYYVDNQYESFSQAFITMFIYLASGENYVEAVSTAYSQDLWNAIFFVSCSLIGLFFITSLFIEAFSGLSLWHTLT